MSSGWSPPPRADSPSVLSNRVFQVRRQNKLESKRLDTRLTYLDAEVAHSRTQISQEQQALRKQLLQIKEVKGNPVVGLERRKMLQINSSKEIRRNSLSATAAVTQITQQRNRSLSDSSQPNSVEFPQINLRPRSKSANNPPFSGNLQSSPFFHKLSLKNDYTNNNLGRRIRQRSYSTNSHPIIPEWEGTDTGTGNDGVNYLKKSDFEAALRGVKESRGCWNDPTKHDPQNRASLLMGKRETGHSESTVLEASESGNSNTSSLQGITVRDLKSINPTVSSQIKRRLQRSYSTSNVPVISEGAVIHVPQSHHSAESLHNLTTKITGRQRTRRINSSEPLSVNNLDVSVVAEGKCPMNVPAPTTRRIRRYSTNSQPVISEGKVVEIVNSKDTGSMKGYSGGESDGEDASSLTVTADVGVTE